RMEGLLKLEARLITGEYFGAESLDFVNKDTDTILVFAQEFKTHGDVYSAGPVLALDGAVFARLVGGDLVWLVEDSRPTHKGFKGLKGVDAKNWGEDIPNPFTALPQSTRDQLAARGVDVTRAR